LGELDRNPARVVHECTGNYIDIFTARQDAKGCSTEYCKENEADFYWLSEHKYGGYGSMASYWGWNKSVILPLTPCSLEGVPISCPHDLKAYLLGEYSDFNVPDHKWSAAAGDYLRINTQTGQFLHTESTLSRLSTYAEAHPSYAAVAVGGIVLLPMMLLAWRAASRGKSANDDETVQLMSSSGADDARRQAGQL